MARSLASDARTTSRRVHKMTYYRETAGAAALAFAEKLQGKPYVFGGTWPQSGGTDCSGLVQWAYEQVGVSLPRTTFSQYLVHQVPKTSLQVGDLLFFKGSDPGPHGEPGHVGIYVSPGRMFNAPFTGDPGGIRFDNYSTEGMTVEFVTRPALALPPKPVVKPPAPKPLPAQDPKAVAYASTHKMSVVDRAEALLAATHHPDIAWYLWNGKTMVGHSEITDIPTNDWIYAFTASLDKYKIPHAGA